MNLEQYSKAKQLPVAFLKELGVTENDGNLEIPYLDSGKKHFRSRLRNDTKRWWGEGEGQIPYGLDRLDPGEYCVITEGESDAQSFWLHGLRALGIPGATTFKAEWAEYLMPYNTLFICRDNDVNGAGQKFVQKVADELRSGGYKGTMSEIRASYGCKDFNDLHVQDPDQFKKKFKVIEQEALSSNVSVIAPPEPQEETTPELTQLPTPDLSLILSDNQQSWLTQYVNIMSGATDAPKIFHVLVGLGILAGACGNRVWFDDVAGKRFLNLYICLLSPAGDGRKSTCVKPAEKIFQDPKRWGDKHMMLANDFSKEAQAQELADNPERLIISSEFKATFDTFNRDYNRGAISRLVSLYDSDPLVIARAGEEPKTTSDISLSIIAASTSEWFLKSLNPGQYEAGLWGRFLLCYAKRTEFKEQPASVADEIDDMGLLAADIGRLFKDERADFSQVTKEQSAFAQEAQKIQESLGEDPKGQLLIGGVARMSTYANKIAVLNAISERKEPVPSPEDYQRAANLVRYLYQCQKYVVDNELAFSPIEQKRNLLKKVIYSEPGITKSNLTRKSQELNSRERGQLLAELQEAKFIKETETPGSTKPIHQFWPYSHSERYFKSGLKVV